MSKGAIQFNENNFEYYTPKEIVNLFGCFDYDLATTQNQAKYLGIPNFDTIDTNGLLADWTSYHKIWINPPFKLKYQFLEKAVNTYTQKQNDIYFLLPITVLTTKKFHSLLGGLGIKLYIPNGRIQFFNTTINKNQSPAFGCVVFKIQKSNEIHFFNL